MIFTKYSIRKFVLISVSCCTLLALAESKEYSEVEKKAIAQLRDLVPDLLARDEYYNNDEFLMRWLTAKNMDVSLAQKGMRESQKWRDENHIDTIVDEKLYDFKTPPYTYHGFDKEGLPIVLFTPTSVDLRALIVAGQRNAAIRLFDQMVEKGYHTLKNLTTLGSDGEKVQQVTAILDLDGFILTQHLCLPCIGVYREWLGHLEKYYPGALKHLVVINMVPIALPFIEVVKPLLSESTRKGFKVFGPNKPEWSKYLFSIISEDQLPARFGGTSKIQI